MNGETISLLYVESKDNATAESLESGGGLVLEHVTAALGPGTYTFTITWRSMVSAGSTDSQCIFCSPNSNSTRTFFVQEIHI